MCLLISITDGCGNAGQNVSHVQQRRTGRSDQRNLNVSGSIFRIVVESFLLVAVSQTDYPGLQVLASRVVLGSDLFVGCTFLFQIFELSQ